MGHSCGGFGVVRADDGHHTGHVVAVVLLDGQGIVLPSQEVEHGLHVVGDVADIHHLVAQQHTRQEAAVVVDLLHREAHGLQEVVAQHLHFIPAGATRGGGCRSTVRRGRDGRASLSLLPPIRNPGVV